MREETSRESTEDGGGEVRRKERSSKGARGEDREAEAAEEMKAR